MKEREPKLKPIARAKRQESPPPLIVEDKHERRLKNFKEQTGRLRQEAYETQDKAEAAFIAKVTKSKSLLERKEILKTLKQCLDDKEYRDKQKSISLTPLKRKARGYYKCFDINVADQVSERQLKMAIPGILRTLDKTLKEMKGMQISILLKVSFSKSVGEERDRTDA